MQLISILLLLLSVVLLIGAILFVVLWHRAYRKSVMVNMLHEGIGHVGVSAVVEYPDTPQPLLALLEEEYPRSEAVIITDLQHFLSPFGELIQRFQLMRVNHSHLEGVRSLFRSRHRAFRRVVMVDLPIEHRHRAFDIAKEVATYDYILQLHGESIVARNTLAYCANIIASHRATKMLSMRSIVGAEAHLERCDTSGDQDKINLRSGRILAWRKGGTSAALFAIVTPTVILFLAHLSGSRAMFVVAVVIITAIVACLYVSCRVMTEKSLFVTLGTILHNFYCFLIEKVKNFHYLYKEGIPRSRLVREIAMIDRRRKNNRKSL